MSPETLVQDRDTTLEFCAAIMKAGLRLKHRQSFSRTFVGWENDPLKEVTWQDAHSIVEGRDAEGRRIYDLSKVDFGDQLMVTHLTGVSMTDVYHDHTTRDPLFQATAFLFGIGRRKKAMADPCMVETLVHRRALDIKGQRDGLTEVWEGVFENWRHLRLDDAFLLKMVRHLDTHHLVYDGAEFSVP